MSRRSIIVSIAVTLLCVFLLTGVVIAYSPKGEQPPKNPQVNYPPAAGVTPAAIGHLVPNQLSDSIQELGLKQYPNLYEEGAINPDGSMTIWLGPGDDSAFLHDLNAIVDSPSMRALGAPPFIGIYRCPTSPAGFQAASDALGASFRQLKAAGYVLATSGPNYQTGTLDVTLYSAPAGVSAAEATKYLRQMVSPIIRVTSVHSSLEF